MSEVTIKNLWGDLPKPDQLVAPISILRHQAGLLSDMTNGLLIGEVKKFPNSPRGIGNSLIVRVPAMGNYTSRLLVIDHGALLYPVDVVEGASSKVYTCDSQEAFESALGQILNSSSTKKLIQGLLSAAKASEQTT